jgi:hypothetical protein
MTLADYYLGDERVVLLPIEHLTPAGMSGPLAALLAARRGWSPARVALFNRGFDLYWQRTAALAARTSSWAPPRLRHVALVSAPLAVRPYAQLLNTSAWTLYESDVDPDRSHPELAAYLLAHGDRMTATGEVATAAVHNAAWWLERSDEECAAFAAAAARSPRPDAEGLRALAAATEWLRRLRHETLRPPVVASPHRPIPGTGLLVPQALEAEPPALVQCWAAVARRAVGTYYAAWRAPDPGAVRALCDWLAGTAPPLLVTAERGRVVWDPETPARLGALRDLLKRAGGAAVRAVAADLAVVDRRTRAFLAALRDPAALPAPAPDTEQSGYAYLHRARGLIAYNLHESGMERLDGPDLPYARAMLGARTVHEWAHLAVTAGWVPRTVSDERFAALAAALAGALEDAIAAAPAAARRAAARDLDALAAGGPAGAALASLLLTRLPDYQANLVAWRFLDEAERETYVRHNVRTLRGLYGPAELWRALVRYLYEYQYLGLSAVADPRAYFLRSTWFDADFLDAGVLTEERFAALAAAVGRLCACHAVDERQVRLP